MTGACFVGPKTAYAGGRFFFKTTDGGYHWDSIFNMQLIGETAGYAHFITETTGWLKGFDGLYKTTDAGDSWTKQIISGFNFHEIFSISFLNDQVAYISDMNNLYKTTNGGTDWVKIYSFGVFSGHDLAFLSETVGYAVSKNNIIKTEDGGLTWNIEASIATEEDLNTIFFVDENNGWAGGNRGTLLKYSK